MICALALLVTDHIMYFHIFIILYPAMGLIGNSLFAPQISTLYFLCRPYLISLTDNSNHFRLEVKNTDIEQPSTTSTGSYF